ncbi:MAG: nucleobase:cation symporter, family [Actinomycetota bacterium]|jgi:putative hydroxymethylpyrimidine transporter CytX|nr:nucleobase:cation symporter, family [Actinomycetota bacterium]
MSTAADLPVREETGSEVSRTLDGPVPRSLGALDQGAFWVNLGVSLLGFTGAATVMMPAGAPPLSFLAALAATVVGTVIGSVMLGLSAVPGAQTQAPSMVLLRGLFGARLSSVPTVLNVLQLVGWGTFELLAITQGAQAIFGGGPAWLYVLITGALTTAMTIWPLGSVRLLRRYVTIAVAISLVYLFVQILRQPVPDLNAGSWQGFWLGTDAALAVAVSFIPLASDYSRHAKSTKAAFSTAFFGYSIAQILCYALGLLVLLQAGTLDEPYKPFLAIPLGAIFLGVLVLREADQSFADTYSTGVSLQNLLPRTDRRVLTIGVGVVTTLLALTMDISQYAGFLVLIGSVFVPLFGVLAADYFGRNRHRDPSAAWDLSETAPSRWRMLLAWVLGLAVYQLIHPGDAGWWSRVWVDLASALHFTPAGWMSASLFSFIVAAVVAWLLGLLPSRR